MSRTQSIDTLLEQRRRVAQRVAAVFSMFPRTSAVIVFGSVAHGQVDQHSDLDMLILCRPTLPSPAERCQLLAKLGTAWPTPQKLSDEAELAIGDEGVVDDVKVSLHYQTVAWIDAVIHEVVVHGAIETPRMPFRPYTLAALLQRAWLLYDADGHVQRWRDQLETFPAALQRTILQHFIPRLRENTGDLVSTAERGLDARLFLFYLNWSIDDMTSILFALNEVYDPADKRMHTMVVPQLAALPNNYAERLNQVLLGPFDAAGMRLRAGLFEQLAAEVLRTAQAQLER